MKIKSLVKKDFETVSLYEGVNAVKPKLLRSGAVIVRDPDTGNNIGLLSVKDLLKSYNLVADCMSLQTPVKEDCKIDEALWLMKCENSNVLPVLVNGNIGGLLFKDDILDYLSLEKILLSRRTRHNKHYLQLPKRDHHASQSVINDLVNSTQSVIFLVDKDYRILFFNKKAYDSSLLLHQRELRAGDSILEYVADTKNDVFKTFRAEFERALNGEIVCVEKEIKYTNEQVIWVRSEYLPVYRDSAVTGVAIYVTDITTSKKQSLLIENQNQALEEILWLQSHKIRQPIASILGLIPILNKNEFTGDNKIAIDLMEEIAIKVDTIIREINEVAQKATSLQ